MVGHDTGNQWCIINQMRDIDCYFDIKYGLLIALLGQNIIQLSDAAVVLRCLYIVTITGMFKTYNQACLRVIIKYECLELIIQRVYYKLSHESISNLQEVFEVVICENCIICIMFFELDVSI
jgi:hypothetical protein